MLVTMRGLGNKASRNRLTLLSLKHHQRKDEMPGVNLPRCTCEHEDVGNGETGPMVRRVNTERDCPIHGEVAEPKWWAEADAMDQWITAQGWGDIPDVEA
jgi:hypothetical protein